MKVFKMLKVSGSFLILWTFVLTVHSFAILDIGTKVEVIKGEAVELSCVADQAWSFCQWSHNGATCNTASQSGATFCQIGGGLEKDRIVWVRKESVAKNFACTIKILTSKMRDAGDWSCLLISQDSNRQQADYSYDVTVYDQTSLAFSARPYREMLVGEQYNIECSGKGGTPEPNLVAAVGRADDSFDEEGREDKLLEPLEHSFLQNPDTGEVTFLKVFRYVPNHSDQMMKVKCVSLQKRPDGRNIFPPKVVTQPFDLVFRPLPNATPLSKFYIEEGRDAQLTITFYAQPPPKSEQIIWHFVREDSVRSETLTAGSATNKYTAMHPVVLGDSGFGTARFGEVNATLIIRGVTIEDTKAYSYLEVSNINGINNFEYEMSISRPPFVSTGRPPFVDDPAPEESLSTGPIVAIVVSIALVLVLVVVVVVLMYKNGKGCFSDQRAPSKEEYFSVDAKDVEMQNMNASGPRRPEGGVKTGQQQQQVTTRDSQHELARQLSANLEGNYMQSSEAVDRNIPDARRNSDISSADQLSPLPPAMIARHPEFSGEAKKTKRGPQQRDSYKIATSPDKYNQRESTYVNVK